MMRDVNLIKAATVDRKDYLPEAVEVTEEELGAKKHIITYIRRTQMKRNYKEPIYTIGIAAKFLKVCIATLRIWEKRGLIEPKRLGRNRFYSQCDIDKLERIKELIQAKHLSIEGVKTTLTEMKCWDIKKCKPKARVCCPVYIKYERS
jgi:hypothetical protein